MFTNMADPAMEHIPSLVWRCAVELERIDPRFETKFVDTLLQNKNVGEVSGSEGNQTFSLPVSSVFADRLLAGFLEEIKKEDIAWYFETELFPLLDMNELPNAFVYMYELAQDALKAMAADEEDDPGR